MQECPHHPFFHRCSESRRATASLLPSARLFFVVVTTLRFLSSVSAAYSRCGTCRCPVMLSLPPRRFSLLCCGGTAPPTSWPRHNTSKPSGGLDSSVRRATCTHPGTRRQRGEDLWTAAPWGGSVSCSSFSNNNLHIGATPQGRGAHLFVRAAAAPPQAGAARKGVDPAATAQ